LNRLDAAVVEPEVRLVMHALEALHDSFLHLIDHVRAFAGVRVDAVNALVVELYLEVLRPASVTPQPATNLG
jgi:hypothetical protein